MNLSVSPAPSVLTVPSVPNGSAAAVASLRQSATILEAVGAASDESAHSVPELLADAAGHARYAVAVLTNDQTPDNDAMIGLLETSVIGPLESGTADLPLTTACARNVADSLALLVGVR